METLIWKKPTISFYRERDINPETDPFVVIKAHEITLEANKKEGYKGVITDFFALMGDIDYISSPKGKNDRYILCWFDDSIDNFSKAFKKVKGVTFPNGLLYTTAKGKRTYKASFQAKYGNVRY